MSSEGPEIEKHSHSFAAGVRRLRDLTSLALGWKTAAHALRTPLVMAAGSLQSAGCSTQRQPTRRMAGWTAGHKRSSAGVLHATSAIAQTTADPDGVEGVFLRHAPHTCQGRGPQLRWIHIAFVS